MTRETPEYWISAATRTAIDTGGRSDAAVIAILATWLAIAVPSFSPGYMRTPPARRADA